MKSRRSCEPTGNKAHRCKGGSGRCSAAQLRTGLENRTEKPEGQLNIAS